MNDPIPENSRDADRIEAVAQAMSDVIRVMKAHKSVHGTGVSGVDPAAAGLLLTIGARQVRVSELAQCMVTDVSTVSRQVSNLAEAGLVDKVPDPSDRRVAIVGLTDDGRRAAEALRSVRLDWFAHLFADWSDADIQQLEVFLRRLVKSVSCELGSRASSLTH